MKPEKLIEVLYVAERLKDAVVIVILPVAGGRALQSIPGGSR